MVDSFTQASKLKKRRNIVRGVYLLRIVDPEHSDHCDDAYWFSISVQTTLNHIRFVNFTEEPFRLSFVFTDYS